MLPNSASDVRIKYVESTHPKYEVKKGGERMVHKNYMGWMHFLQQDIDRNLQLISATSNG